MAPLDCVIQWAFLSSAIISTHQKKSLSSLYNYKRRLMNLTDLVTGGVGSKAIETISKITGISESKAKWIVAAAVPLMIAALNYNAKNKGQAENIDKAIDQHSNSGILDKIGDFFGQGGAEQGGEQNVSEDGNKIVNHMFGQIPKS